MYSFVEPGCFHVPPQCIWAPFPTSIQLFLNISVNRVEVREPSVDKVEVPIQRFGADSAGLLHVAARSMLCVKKMQAYHPGDVDQGLCTGTDY